MRDKFLFMLFALLIFFSCSKNTVDPGQKEPFAVNIQVVDSNNNPLENINVSIWDKINSIQATGGNSVNPDNVLQKSSQNKIMAATVFQFDLPQSCFVSMAMSNLEGKTAKDLIISKKLQAGSYRYTWSTAIPDGVFKCKFTASSDSLNKEVVYEDSIYTVLIAPDPSISSIGKTDAGGKITTSDKMRFAGLYDLPPIPYTSSSGPEVLGTLTFSDSVIISLTDESFSNEKIFYCKIEDGASNIKLNWDEGLAGPENRITRKSSYTGGVIGVGPGGIPETWKLYQNFPNPFN